MARVRDIIGNSTTAAIVVDCTDLIFIDCAGLTEVLEWNTLAAQHGKVLCFKRVPRPLRRILEVCDVNALTVTDYLAESS